MLTEIVLKRDFYDEEAERLKSCFSPGVIELVNVKGKFFDVLEEIFLTCTIKNHNFYRTNEGGCIECSFRFVQSTSLYAWRI